jgi:beta-xylosidase
LPRAHRRGESRAGRTSARAYSTNEVHRLSTTITTAATANHARSPTTSAVGTEKRPEAIETDLLEIVPGYVSTEVDAELSFDTKASIDKAHRFIAMYDEIGVPNSTDPMVYVRDGTPVLFWGSFHGIYAVELSDDGTSVAGEKTRIAGNDYEGTYIHERDGEYYFFGSVGTCCDGVFSTYHVRVGRSDSLLGPYEDPDGNDLRDVQGSVVVEEGNGFVGPGHNTVVTDDAGEEWRM